MECPTGESCIGAGGGIMFCYAVPDGGFFNRDGGFGNRDGGGNNNGDGGGSGPGDAATATDGPTE
jgi:hypothetical protein